MKEKIGKIYNVLKSIPIRTYVSFVLVIIALINYALLAAGKPIINLGEEEVTYAINTIISIIAIIYGVWKNNSVSDKAILADDVLYLLRDGKISKEELEEFIAKHKVETPEATEEAKEETTEEVKPETVETIESTETTEETK